MQLNCQKREVRYFETINDARFASVDIARCIWAQLVDNDKTLYKVFPDGRVVSYTILGNWKKDKPEVTAEV